MCRKAVRLDEDGRCMSMVVVAFRNLDDCFSPANEGEEEPRLELPFRTERAIRRLDLESDEVTEDARSESTGENHTKANPSLP